MFNWPNNSASPRPFNKTIPRHRAVMFKIIFKTKAHLKLSCLSVFAFGLFLMNLILYGYSFPFTYGSLGQTPALPRPPLDPTKCKSVIPCAFTRSLKVSLFFQMDNFLQGLPTLNLTKWITDEPFLKRIPEPAFPTQVFKHYCILFWRNASRPWFSPHKRNLSN